jgi:hypothetical protein
LKTGEVAVTAAPAMIVAGKVTLFPFTVTPAGNEP